MHYGQIKNASISHFIYTLFYLKKKAFLIMHIYIVHFNTQTKIIILQNNYVTVSIIIFLQYNSSIMYYVIIAW